jgi:hypothetical protein
MKYILVLVALAGCYDYRSSVTLHQRETGLETVADLAGRCTQQHDYADAYIVGCHDRRAASTATQVAGLVVALPLLLVLGAAGSAPVH